MSLAVIKKYAGPPCCIFSLLWEDYPVENPVVLLREINYIPSVSFFLPVIESQGKINASGIIFNLGVK